MKIRLDVIKTDDNSVVHRELMEWPDNEQWPVGYIATLAYLNIGSSDAYHVLFTRVF